MLASFSGNRWQNFGIFGNVTKSSTYRGGREVRLEQRGDAAQPKVGHLDEAVASADVGGVVGGGVDAADQQVGRLQVAMQHHLPPVDRYKQGVRFAVV